MSSFAFVLKARQNRGVVLSFLINATQSQVIILLSKQMWVYGEDVYLIRNKIYLLGVFICRYDNSFQYRFVELKNNKTARIGEILNVMTSN